MNCLPAVKDVVRTLLYRTGLLGAWHRLRNRHTLTVLMFHRVLPAGSTALAQSEREFAFSVEGFGRTLDFVARHYHVIRLAQLKDAIEGRAALPPRALLITFDDGWRDTVVHAMPELERRGLPALLFLATEVLDLPQPRWWQDAAVAMLADPQAAPRLLRALNIPADAVAQTGFSQQLAARLAGLPESERRRIIDLTDSRVLPDITERQMMDARDLRHWVDRGFDVGGHGHTHAPIPYAIDPAGEITLCKHRLESLGLTGLSLSYPHGVKNAHCRELLRGAGFQVVFDSHAGLANAAHLAKLQFDIPRIHVPENAWTCRDGRIDEARLATFLFARPRLGGAH